MAEQVEAVVDVKSAWLSKINWGEIIKIAAMLLTAFFGIDVSPDMQVKLLQGIIAIGGLYTVITKTFFTNTITPSSAAK